jgi:flagellar export protein FliJ
MDALAVLTRLARQALDEERRALAQIDQAIDGIRALLVEARAAATRERRAAGALVDGHARLLAYLGRMNGQTASLEAELRRLGERREEHGARLSERHLELRRLEILVERRAERARTARLRREQKAIDELLAARQHRGC